MGSKFVLLFYPIDNNTYIFAETRKTCMRRKKFEGKLKRKIAIRLELTVKEQRRITTKHLIPTPNVCFDAENLVTLSYG